MAQLHGSNAAQAPGAQAVAALVREALANLDRDPVAARHCLVNAEKILAPSPPVVARGGLAPWQAKRAAAYIDHHLGERMEVPTLARLVGLSPNYFSRGFRISFGLPFTKFVIRKRVERAQTLMMTARSRLSDVALHCGFADQSHFCRAFTRLIGKSPARWRRSALAGENLRA